jgi:hypothetical protein
MSNSEGWIKVGINWFHKSSPLLNTFERKNEQAMCYSQLIK